MRNRVNWAAASRLFGSALLAALLFFACKPAATQESARAKQFCVGCSTDGKTTPRATDGHPDLSGYWGGGFVPAPGATAPGNQPVAAALGTAAVLSFQKDKDGSILLDNSTEYNEGEGAGRICQSESCQVPNQPPYNDTYLTKVKAIAKTEFGGTTDLDPIQSCRAAGVPRAGVPNYVMQTADTIVFFYNAAPYSTYRIVYLGGRPHPDMKTYETTYFGDSIGHWEGDTLVIDTVGFNDDTWLGGGGAVGTAQFTSIHTEKEHAVERLTRDGDVLTYNVTVEDPDALTRPWVLAARRIRHSGPGMEVPGEDALTENICVPTENFALPNPEDKDIKLRCGYRCDAATDGVKKNY